MKQRKKPLALKRTKQYVFPIVICSLFGRNIKYIYVCMCIFNLFPYYLTHSRKHKSNKCIWYIAHWIDSVLGSAIGELWKLLETIYIADSFPRCESIKCQWMVVFYFFICWHVQILNILKYFKDHIFWSVMSINYFPVTRTKFGTFQGLLMFFKALKFHTIISVFC